jgi:hypothetical protein
MLSRAALVARIDVEETFKKLELLAAQLPEDSLDATKAMETLAWKLQWEGKYPEAEQMYQRIEARLRGLPKHFASSLWNMYLRRAENAAHLGDRALQKTSLDNAESALSTLQPLDGLDRLEITLWQQCLAEQSPTNAVARLAKELGPEHYRVKALERCWN